LERGALDSKPFTELTSFDHKQDPVEAAVAGERIEAAIAVNVLVLLQSGIPEARLGLAEQAAWSTPADETGFGGRETVPE
jgi:hypothetical protein